MELNGKATAISIAATVLTALSVAIMGALGSSYVREQDAQRGEIRGLRDDHVSREDLHRAEADLHYLNGQRELDAYSRGRSDQRLDQLTERAQRNQDRSEISAKELDDKLQRETDLKSARVEALVVDADHRLQTELGTLMEGIRERMRLVEEWRDQTAGTVWTRDAQDKFERQLGIQRTARASDQSPQP